MLNAHELKQNMNLILWETCCCIIKTYFIFNHLCLCQSSQYSSCSDFSDYWKWHLTTIIFQLFFRQLKNEQGSFLVNHLQSHSHFPALVCTAMSLTSIFEN